MIANISVITDNLDYLLWGRMAQGQPGGVLLTLLMAFGAALLALPGGIVLACCAAVFWRDSQSIVHLGGVYSRHSAHLCDFLDVVFAPHADRKRSSRCRYRDAGVGMVHRRLGDALSVRRNQRTAAGNMMQQWFRVFALIRHCGLSYCHRCCVTCCRRSRGSLLDY